MPDLVVCGGGIIGLSVAWEAAREGRSVTVVDPAPGSGATSVAAGMIAPVTEAHYGEEALLRANLASAQRWPAFAARLEEASGCGVGYDDAGTLAVAADPSDRVALEELARFHTALGLPSTPMGALACRRAEPLLAPGISGGLDVPGDHRVEPRKVAAALLVAIDRAGGEVVADEVTSVLVESGRCAGVATASGATWRAPVTLLAAGWASAGLAGLPESVTPPVRPVKGQLLRLRLPAGLPAPVRTVRALVRGQMVYVVPRPGGEVVVGATSEELGTDRRVTAGAVYQLLRDATAVMPILAEAEVEQLLAGLRPGSPDNAPLVGESGLDGLLVATGHFRHGILLAPLTAELVAAHLRGEPVEASWPAFDPRRFAPAAA